MWKVFTCYDDDKCIEKYTIEPHDDVVLIGKINPRFLTSNLKLGDIVLNEIGEAKMVTAEVLEFLSNETGAASSNDQPPSPPPASFTGIGRKLG